MQEQEAAKMASQFPEARVLIVMTGGTICMRSSPEGLVPARGFLEAGMKPRPSFNDGSNPGMSVFLMSCLCLCLSGVHQIRLRGCTVDEGDEAAGRDQWSRLLGTSADVR